MDRYGILHQGVSLNKRRRLLRAALEVDLHDLLEVELEVVEVALLFGGDGAGVKEGEQFSWYLETSISNAKFKGHWLAHEGRPLLCHLAKNGRSTKLDWVGGDVGGLGIGVRLHLDVLAVVIVEHGQFSRDLDVRDRCGRL